LELCPVGPLLAGQLQSKPIDFVRELALPAIA
jgi:hypothetical protein